MAVLDELANRSIGPRRRPLHADFSLAAIDAWGVDTTKNVEDWNALRRAVGARRLYSRDKPASESCVR